MGLTLGRWHVSLMMVLIILGFLVATAFSTQQRWQQRPGPRKQYLVDFIKEQRGDRTRLAAELQRLREQQGDERRRVAANQGAMAALSQALEDRRMIAGLTPVKGPGVAVVLGDAVSVPPGANPDNYIIHDYDVRLVVNALWRGGAEAIAVGGERLVATTAVRSAGTSILVNAKPLGSPYRIVAIGRPERLLKALENDRDAADFLQAYGPAVGLTARTRRLPTVRIPAYQGSLKMTNAR